MGIRASAFDAAEGSVDIRIMRLEPVAKRPPQHARGRARRAAFHHEVFPVEEIRGIAGIKRERFKPRKRREKRARPFPSIAGKVGNTEVAGPVGKRSDRSGIPSLKIEMAVPGPRWLRTPGIRALAAIARHASGAMPLRGRLFRLGQERHQGSLV